MENLKSAYSRRSKLLKGDNWNQYGYTRIEYSKIEAKIFSKVSFRYYSFS